MIIEKINNSSLIHNSSFMNSNHSWALITGGAKRLGAFLAENIISSLGVTNLILHYNSSEEVVRKLKERIVQMNPAVIVTLIKADFSEIVGIEKFIECIKSYNINILINNASSFIQSDFFYESDLDFVQMNNINYIAPLLIAKALIKNHLEAQSLDLEQLKIINMLDIRRTQLGPTIKAYGRYFDYSLTKHSLYLAHTYLKNEIALRDCRNITICGLLLGDILPDEIIENEYYDSHFKELGSIYKLHKIINSIISFVIGKDKHSNVDYSIP